MRSRIDGSRSQSRNQLLTNRNRNHKSDSVNTLEPSVPEPEQFQVDIDNQLLISEILDTDVSVLDSILSEWGEDDFKTLHEIDNANDNNNNDNDKNENINSNNTSTPQGLPEINSKVFDDVLQDLLRDGSTDLDFEQIQTISNDWDHSDITLDLDTIILDPFIPFVIQSNEKEKDEEKSRLIPWGKQEDEDDEFTFNKSCEIITLSSSSPSPSVSPLPSPASRSTPASTSDNRIENVLTFLSEEDSKFDLLFLSQSNSKSKFQSQLQLMTGMPNLTRTTTTAKIPSKSRASKEQVKNFFKTSNVNVNVNVKRPLIIHCPRREKEIHDEYAKTRILVDEIEKRNADKSFFEILLPQKDSCPLIVERNNRFYLERTNKYKRKQQQQISSSSSSPKTKSVVTLDLEDSPGVDPDDDDDDDDDECELTSKNKLPSSKSALNTSKMPIKMPITTNKSQTQIKRTKTSDFDSSSSYHHAKKCKFKNIFKQMDGPGLGSGSGREDFTKINYSRKKSNQNSMKDCQRENLKIQCQSESVVRGHCHDDSDLRDFDVDLVSDSDSSDSNSSSVIICDSDPINFDRDLDIDLGPGLGTGTSVMKKSNQNQKEIELIDLDSD